jgi:hypothetical protein
MRKLLLIVAALSLPAMANTWVNGYTKADGTYVAGHYKTDANATKLDNYSTKGNANPYTGAKGTVDPYKVEPYKAPKIEPSKPIKPYKF